MMIVMGMLVGLLNAEGKAGKFCMTFLPQEVP